MDDGYMGSGKIIKRAIEKHGIDNFKKDILEMFDDSTSMYAREKELVTDEFLLREDTYNLRRGGTGGFDFINKSGLNGGGFKDNILLRKVVRRNRMLQTGVFDKDVRQLGKAAAKERKVGCCHDPIIQARCSLKANQPDAKRKRQRTFEAISHQQGSRNSQFDTCWIYHDLIGNKKCKRDLLPFYIDQGWIKGRIYN